MRRWLIDIPALIVDIYARVYILIVAVASLILWTSVVIALLLAGAGIRWGW